MRRHEIDPDAEAPAWVRFAKVALLLAGAVIVFLLVHTMVKHRFFRGGALNYRETTIRP